MYLKYHNFRPRLEICYASIAGTISVNVICIPSILLGENINERPINTVRFEVINFRQYNYRRMAKSPKFAHVNEWSSCNIYSYIEN